jgi:hypothetical protein
MIAVNIHVPEEDAPWIYQVVITAPKDYTTAKAASTRSSCCCYFIFFGWQDEE